MVGRVQRLVWRPVLWTRLLRGATAAPRSADSAVIRPRTEKRSPAESGWFTCVGDACLAAAGAGGGGRARCPRRSYVGGISPGEATYRHHSSSSVAAQLRRRGDRGGVRCSGDDFERCYERNVSALLLPLKLELFTSRSVACSCGSVYILHLSTPLLSNGFWPADHAYSVNIYVKSKTPVNC